MISVTEARQLIAQNCTTKRLCDVALHEANGYILAEDVYAQHETPPFDQSAMDGYAFAFDSWDGKNLLQVIGEIQAGGYFAGALNSNEAMRIFTGAPVPPGADTVVMQEKVRLEKKSLLIHDELLRKGSNVRLKGSQTKKGEIALAAGQLLTPASLSFLAGIGIQKVKVHSKPSVSILVTGKELVKPGTPIKEGEIFESNSFGLVAGLGQIGISPVSLDFVDDDEEEIVNKVKVNLDFDILIITGGVSVGDYDFVVPALAKCSVQTIFHKVKQKPGKPFYFGMHGQLLLFGLPGNPASVMTCFYEYIVPAITLFTGREYFRKEQMHLKSGYKKKAGLTHFLKGKTNSDGVTILPHQESYLMDSFAIADCLIELPEDQEIFNEGDLVNIQMLI